MGKVVVVVVVVRVRGAGPHTHQEMGLKKGKKIDFVSLVFSQLAFWGWLLFCQHHLAPTTGSLFLFRILSFSKKK